MDKKTKIAGLIALGAGAYFFHKSRQDFNSKLEGLKVDLDADKFIDSAGKSYVSNPVIREGLVKASKTALGHLLASKGIIG